MKSWKTTTLGILGIVAAVATLLISVLTGEFDGAHLTALMAAVGVIFPSIGNLFSRDDDVTSEGTKAPKTRK